MITIFQGTLGSGKSASMVVNLVDHLLSGGVAAANFRLIPGWAEKLAKMKLLCRLGLKDWRPIADDLESRFTVVNTLEEVWAASNELIPKATGKVAQQYEGHGRLYLDECQLIFNSREWASNKDWIHFFSQSRKLKWDVILVAHNINMIDKQIRPFIEFETRFRDMRKIKFMGFIPLSLPSVPMFLAITRYAGISAGAGEIYKRDVYPLQKHISMLYDSALVFGADKTAHYGEHQDEVTSPPERSERGEVTSSCGRTSISHELIPSLQSPASYLVRQYYPSIFQCNGR